MEGILFPRGIVEGKEGLDAYRARGGYQALEKALKQMSPRGGIQKNDAAPPRRRRAGRAGAIKRLRKRSSRCRRGKYYKRSTPPACAAAAAQASPRERNGPSPPTHRGRRATSF